MCGRFAARDRISGESVRVRSLAGQLREGLPRVYAAAISGHRESPPVQRIRCNEAPEVTDGDSSRQLPITRNEGVENRDLLPRLTGPPNVFSHKDTSPLRLSIP